MTTDTAEAAFSPAAGKTAPAELVTEEMIATAIAAADAEYPRSLNLEECVSAAVRAVAPMIAARVPACANLDGQLWYRLDEVTRMLEVEREACAQIADETATEEGGFPIAAAIRARGNAPERRGE